MRSGAGLKLALRPHETAAERRDVIGDAVIVGCYEHGAGAA